MSTSSTGNSGCPCIDASKILYSLQKRWCQTESGESGVLMEPRMASCVPLYYGSSSCLQHDKLYNPVCQDPGDEMTFCLRTWCYVDLDTCKINSTEKVARSDVFRTSLGPGGPDRVDLFYSYTTCNSTDVDWENYKINNSQGDKILGGVSLLALAKNIYPFGYKLGLDGELLDSSAPEYWNDTVPWQGVYIDYINDLIRISNRDIAKVDYTYLSKGAKTSHPDSLGTATVMDVGSGLVDLGVGPLWITGERLKKTPFTVPIPQNENLFCFNLDVKIEVYDKTVLVVPMPGFERSVLSEAGKVWQPFSIGLWAIIVSIILVSALLSVWFTEHKRRNVGHMSKSLRKLHEKRNRHSRIHKVRSSTLRIYAWLALDSVLQKGMYFFGAAVEQDDSASLSNKLLMFGFAFFILIVVSAYVANLAAFLTRPIEQYIVTFPIAVNEGKKICGHPALKEELVMKWPDARFVFRPTGGDWRGVLEDYDARKCDMMAVSREDTMMDKELVEMFCERNLVYTDSLIIEVPIALPAQQELVSGLSYWILQGEKFHGVSIENAKRKYLPDVRCNVEFEAQQEQDLGDEYAQISAGNMILPILAFISFAGSAVIVRIWERKKKFKKAGAIVIKRALPLYPATASKNNTPGLNEQPDVDGTWKTQFATSVADDDGTPLKSRKTSFSFYDEWIENVPYDGDDDEDDEGTRGYF